MIILSFIVMACGGIHLYLLFSTRRLFHITKQSALSTLLKRMETAVNAGCYDRNEIYRWMGYIQWIQLPLKEQSKTLPTTFREPKS